MSWNTSLIAGPFQVPIYGAPTTDTEGDAYTPVTGYQPGVVFVLPADRVAAALAPAAGPVPQGVPVLGGVPCLALTFDSEEAAKGPLAAYWLPD